MANSYLTFNETTTPANQTKFTYSAWIKRSKLGSDQTIFYNYKDSNNYAYMYFRSADDIRYFDRVGGGDTAIFVTTRLFRDTSAWYHLVLQVDTTQGTAGDRIKFYVNGVQETFASSTIPNQNQALSLPREGTRTIGASNGGSNHFDGYQSHVAFVDSTSPAYTTFGSTDATSGIWKFKSPSGVTWGNTGFHLKFENSGALGTDSSGNSSTFTVNGNLTQTVDTPSINWVTFNPLLNSGSGQVSYSRANTRGGTGGGLSYLTMMPTTGKWFMEFNINVAGAGQDNGIGFWSIDEAQRIAFYQSGFKGIVWKYAGNVYANGSNNAFSSNTFTSGDIISVAMDMDNSTATFYKNGSVATNLNAYSFPFTEREAISVGIMDGAVASAEDGIFDFNSGANPTFGGRKTAGGNADGNSQGNFSMAVPSGYYALNTKNLNTYG